MLPLDSKISAQAVLTKISKRIFKCLSLPSDRILAVPFLFNINNLSYLTSHFLKYSLFWWICKPSPDFIKTFDCHHSIGSLWSLNYLLKLICLQDDGLSDWWYLDSRRAFSSSSSTRFGLLPLGCQSQCLSVYFSLSFSSCYMFHICTLFARRTCSVD